MSVGTRGDNLVALRTWLLETALPFWLAHGVDRARGSFFEALDLHSHACVAPFRRLRVAARQVTVFARAHQAGVAGADEAVQLGLDFLARHAAQEDGGYAWRFDLAHRPIDLTRDLYDHAFVLLAFASAAPVIGVAKLRARARALLDWLEANFAHPSGGYLESLPPTLPRRQNPHMHLLEALLAAHEAFDDEIYLAQASALLNLFATRLLDATTGALPEYFDERLRPLRHQGVFRVEPGHHCEWVWLLHRAQAFGLGGSNMTGVAARLMDFVDRHATHPRHGGLVDEIGSDGAVLEAGARLWPQTERLRAEFLRPGASLLKQADAASVLCACLRPDGLWHERRAADGSLLDAPAPASSLYHLTGAILDAPLPDASAPG